MTERSVRVLGRGRISEFYRIVVKVYVIYIKLGISIGYFIHPDYNSSKMSTFLY